MIGPDEPILIPSISQRVDYEGEFAIVIGETCYMPAAGEDLRLPPFAVLPRNERETPIHDQHRCTLQ